MALREATLTKAKAMLLAGKANAQDRLVGPHSTTGYQKESISKWRTVPSRIGSCGKRKKFENRLRRDYASSDQRALPTAFSGSKARRVGKEKHEEKEPLLPDAYRVLHRREWVNKLRMPMAVQIFSGRRLEKGELASEDRYGTLPGPGPGNCKVIGQWMMNTRLGIASGTRDASKPSSREVE